MATNHEANPAADTASDQPTLSVVIPMYHEAENVAPLLAEVHDALADYPARWELICVDDGSTDGTARIARDEGRRYGPHVRVIELRRNFGQTAAMQTGIEATRGEVVATLDGDLQNDPADIPRLVAEMKQRDLDLLAGWRKDRQDKQVRSLFSRVANRLIGKVTGVELHDYGCSLKVYRREVIQQVVLLGEMHRFIPVWVATITSPERIAETVVNHRPRRFGTSKYTLSRTFRVLLDLLSAFFFLKYRSRPGHFFGAIGLLFGAVGSLAMTWLAIVKFGLGEDIGGRPLLIVGVLCLLASIQFLTTGVLAEMLTRTFYASAGGRAAIFTRSDEPRDALWKEPTGSDVQ